MIHGTFIYRQLTRSRKQASVFVLCVVLSMVSLIALNGFSDSVNQSLLRDARKLHAGDIIIKSRHAFSPGIRSTVDAFRERGAVESARIYEFYSVVRNPAENRSVLSMLKIAGAGYPFYGRVGLASEKPFHQVLGEGRVVVERGLLERIGASVGDQLQVGSASLTIVDVVTVEPDRPVSFFSFGPRVFVHPDDLETIDLVNKRSRVRHRLLLKVADPAQMDAIAADLSRAATPDVERVETFRNANSRMKRFFDNFLFFLNLVGLFTLLLAGIGIQSSLAAFLKTRTYTMAIVKTLGGTSGFVIRHYLLLVLILGAAGTLLGVIGGYLLQTFLPPLFAGFLPDNTTVTVSWPAVIESLLLGILVVAMFAYLPMSRLKSIRPTAIFRLESGAPGREWAVIACGAGIMLVFTAMVLWQLKDIRLGVYFLGGIVAFLLVIGLLTQAVSATLKHWSPRRLALRQAVNGLFRPGNSTRPILMTLTASLAVIFTVYQIESNLDRAYIQSYPDEAPNVFFIDIQSNQAEAFRTLVGETAMYPIIRARVRAVNEERIDPANERRRKGDNFSREFNLTYRHTLLDDERLIDGSALFRQDWQGPQVSVLDTVVRMRRMGIGDTIEFNIQGVPLKARVSSIRTRTEESLKPYFYFVFPNDVLEKAPQTLFAALRIEKDRISTLQNQIVARFPNISVIDITETAQTFSVVLRRLSRIIRFFTSFSIVAGLLILISAILATRAARMREAVYFKILGARGMFVRNVFAWENAILGGISAVMALFIAHIAAWIISTRFLDIDYHALPVSGAAMVVLPVVLVLGVGMAASRSILRKKPVTYLRETDTV